MPQAPEGFQRPGVPGAGNIMDPAVRGEIRKIVHEAMHDIMRRARGGHEADGGAAAAQPTPPESTGTDTRPAAEAENRPAESNRPVKGLGPFPHGDVDLSYIAANVPPEAVKPNRARAARRFYFLPEDAQPTTPRPATPAGPKPG